MGKKKTKKTKKNGGGGECFVVNKGKLSKKRENLKTKTEKPTGGVFNCSGLKRGGGGERTPEQKENRGKKKKKVKNVGKKKRTH